MAKPEPRLHVRHLGRTRGVEVARGTREPELVGLGARLADIANSVISVTVAVFAVLVLTFIPEARSELQKRIGILRHGRAAKEQAP